jgi:predicted small lipoprotein YifL
MRVLILAALLALTACGAEAPPQVPGGPDLSDFWSG